MRKKLLSKTDSILPLPDKETDNLSPLPNPPHRREGNNVIYCSLDIETTGFDPKTEEIIEVGFILFVIEDFGFKILEEWTKVFKPTKEVSAKILGLTGISQKELAEGEDFENCKKFIQEKIGNAVVVGHNVIFDIKFLESKGIKFSGKVVDTLDLAQWILPTHHSYNLENLMHFFGIVHEEAHRALMDARAALEVLKKLLQEYLNFPKELKEKIEKIAQEQKFIWQDLFLQKLPLKTQSQKFKKPKQNNLQKIYNFAGFNMAKHGLVRLKFGEDAETQVKELVEEKKDEKILLVLPDIRAVGRFWQHYHMPPVVASEDNFDEKKFEEIANQKEKSDILAKFILKVLVWQSQNWQNISLYDLNLTFSGGQFKQLVSKIEHKFSENQKAWCIDAVNFFKISSEGTFKKRKVLVYGLAEFEASALRIFGRKISSGYLTYLIKRIYDPEQKIGNSEFEEKCREALSAIDLFFGLAGALLLPEGEMNANLRIDVSSSDEKISRLVKAAENFSEKLKYFGKALNEIKLTEAGNDVFEYFKQQENLVKWVEVNQRACAFFSAPIDLSGFIEDLRKESASITFVQDFGHPLIEKYFSKRFNLDKHKIFEAEKQVAQKSLFDFFASGAPAVHLNARKASGMDFEKLYSSGLPLAMLLSNQLEINELYEAYYEKLKTKAYILTQSHGGSGKLVNNFSIHKDSILMVSNKFLLSYIRTAKSPLTAGNLEVKNLAIGAVPFEIYTHPYQEAVAKTFSNPFEDYSLARALINLDALVKFFNSRHLKRIFMFDPKLAKDYARVIIEYFENFTNGKVKIQKI